MKILKVKQKDRATGSRVLHFASRLALGTVSIKCSVLTLCVVCEGLIPALCGAEVFSLCSMGPQNYIIEVLWNLRTYLKRYSKTWPTRTWGAWQVWFQWRVAPSVGTWGHMFLSLLPFRAQHTMWHWIPSAYCPVLMDEFGFVLLGRSSALSALLKNIPWSQDKLLKNRCCLQSLISLHQDSAWSCATREQLADLLLRLASPTPGVKFSSLSRSLWCSQWQTLS